MKMTAIRGKVQLGPGIFLDPILNGTNVAALNIVDADGKILMFIKEQYSSLVILVPAPPETKPVYVVHGTISGVPVQVPCEDRHVAEDVSLSVRDATIVETAVPVDEEPF